MKVLALTVLVLGASAAALILPPKRSSMSSPQDPNAFTATHPQLGADEAARQDPAKVVKSDAEWQRLLPREQYRVLRHAGTEIAFTGRYWNEHRRGIYRCAACGYDLFSSDTKFESGTGWPSFWAPILGPHVEVVRDASLGVVRDEVRCARCGSHLGHVFDDGPKPTGLRYCMNSAALSFAEAKK
jgi:peptide-methionine (R)-S-oxide reductase